MANKKRRCRACKTYKEADKGLLINNGFYCDINCATDYAFKNKEQGRKIKHREQKKEFRQSDLKIRKAAAKKACHEYIRYRDKDKLCICCDRPLGNKFDAGHWLESGNNPLIRYHEDNIHAQNVYCNQYKGGDSDDYEGRLRLKIGDDKVNWLLTQKGGTIKRNCEDYKEIELHYKNKLNMLKLNSTQ